MKKTSIALVAVAALLAACGGGGGSDTTATSTTVQAPSQPAESVTPNVPVNTAPVAKIADVQSVITGRAFMLDGSGSTDVDGDTLSFEWSLQSVPAGSTANLGDKAIAKPSFTADLAGDYVFGLVVNDGKSNSAQVSITVSVAKATWKDADCSHSGTALPACGTHFSDNGSSVTVQQDGSITALKFETLATPLAAMPSQNTGIKGNRATLGLDFLHGVKLSEFEGISFKAKDDGTGETGAGLPYVTYSISKECDGTVWNNLITNLTDMTASGPDADGYFSYSAAVSSPSWKSTSWSTSIKAKDGNTAVLPPNGSATAASLDALIAEYPNACIYNWPNPSAADPTTAKTPAVMLMLGNSTNVTAKFVWIRDLMIGTKSIF
ncbi:PKD domain-containing protein [Variovorax dokdonensis]|uniref:PKD domain-containing protein n=1 Tax=Variovorax dokdonensis TaxID=344883 RepID=A0ABT7NEA1_9BURK|nr:PKD domain-containing protein [Variovorax dokdonensis]MDM0046277.1 PKD domain-containing protein [Variovorax dokdonensis]